MEIITLEASLTKSVSALSNCANYAQSRRDKNRSIMTEPFIINTLAQDSDHSLHFTNILKDITRHGLLDIDSATKIIENIEASLFRVRLTPDINEDTVKYYSTAMLLQDMTLENVLTHHLGR